MDKKGLTKAQKTIRESFLELLRKRNFYDIKITDILSSCGLSRSSFYVYYKDKYDLLDSIQADILRGIAEIFREVRESSKGKTLTTETNPNAPAIYSRYFEFLETCEDELRLLFGPNGDGYFIQRFIDFVFAEQAKTRSYWGVGKSFPALTLEHYTTITSYGYTGIFIRWINAPVDKRLSALAMGGVLAEFFTHQRI